MLFSSAFRFLLVFDVKVLQFCWNADRSCYSNAFINSLVLYTCFTRLSLSFWLFFSFLCSPTWFRCIFTYFLGLPNPEQPNNRLFTYRLFHMVIISWKPDLSNGFRVYRLSEHICTRICRLRKVGIFVAAKLYKRLCVLMLYTLVKSNEVHFLHNQKWSDRLRQQRRQKQQRQRTS